MRTASSAATARARWSTSRSPPKMRSSTAPTATTTTSRPAATAAKRSFVLVSVVPRPDSAAHAHTVNGQIERNVPNLHDNIIINFILECSLLGTPAVGH